MTGSSFTDFRDLFANPPQDVRPEVRWWLAEGLHTDETLRTEIEAAHRMGFGGMEFLAMDEGQVDHARYGWGSEEWVHDSAVVVAETTARGMAVSFTSGTNWSNANLPTITPESDAAAKELDMTVEEALEFFKAVPRVRDVLALLHRVGLDYIHVGQQATTLSGGEAQRVKLAAHLAQVRAANANAKPSQASRVLYILDEPTTGLHFDDVSRLLTAFRKLIDGGGSLIVIEHNLDVIKCADWVIDLGPEGGEGGGKIVAQGTPEEIAGNLHSYTGKWLGRVL